MFRGMGTVGQALAVMCVAGIGLAYAGAQEDGSSTVDIVQVQPLGESAGAKPASPEQQRKAAQAAVAAASSSCAAQAQALQAAKRDRDIIRATCLDDKMAQCEANLQNMKRRQAALDEAIGTGDLGRTSHESTVIGVLSQKFKMLEQAANQCIGQDMFDTGETANYTEVGLFAPDQPPNVVPTVPEWPIPFIPPPVSGVN